MKRTGRRLSRVSVMLEKADGSVEYRTWKTYGSIARLRKKIKQQYEKEFPGVIVSFGNAICTNHYGAH